MAFLSFWSLLRCLIGNFRVKMANASPFSEATGFIGGRAGNRPAGNQPSRQIGLPAFLSAVPKNAKRGNTFLLRKERKISGQLAAAAKADKSPERRYRFCNRPCCIPALLYATIESRVYLRRRSVCSEWLMFHVFAI